MSIDQPLITDCPEQPVSSFEGVVGEITTAVEAFNVLPAFDNNVLEPFFRLGVLDDAADRPDSTEIVPLKIIDKSLQEATLAKLIAAAEESRKLLDKSEIDSAIKLTVWSIISGCVIRCRDIVMAAQRQFIPPLPPFRGPSSVTAARSPRPVRSPVIGIGEYAEALEQAGIEDRGKSRVLTLSEAVPLTRPKTL